MSSQIPFLDLHSQVLPLRNELDAAIARVIDSCAFILGEDVAEFESEFAQFCNAQHAVGVDSGTSALTLILRALDIGPGDEVVLPPNTFIATAEAISTVGARPVFADVDEQTQLLDPQQVRSVIGPRTRAIIAVHLFGRTAPMRPLLEIAAKAGIHVIEDACQAHGARYRSQRVGSLGIAAAFSFYPGKNLGAFGDAGAVTTDDAGLAQAVRELRDHGQPRKHEHQRHGCTGRLDTVQAAVLRVKLRHLESWNAMRRQAAARYATLLCGSEFRVPAPIGVDEDHVFHLYAVRHPNRAAVIRALQDNQVGCGVHYPVPIHRTPAYAWLGLGEGSFPNAERMAGQVLSLPMYPELSDAHIEHVCEVMTEAASVS